MEPRCPVVFADGSRCPRLVCKRGLCRACYEWSRRNGGASPNGRAPNRRPGEPLAELTTAAKSATDECILFTGRNGDLTNVTYDGRNMPAARAVWFIAHGDPGDAFICHTCNGGSGEHGCVNLRHLYLGTPGDNTLDSVASGRWRGPGHGEGHHNTTLSASEVHEIKRRWTTERAWGFSTAERFAAEYGVSLKTIYNIVNHKTWALG